MPLTFDVLARAWRPARPLPDSLPAWLAARRWFSGKGQVIAAVDLVDVTWLPGDGLPPDACVVLDVAFADGGTHRYALWLGIRAGQPDAAVDTSGLEPGLSIVEIADRQAGVLTLLSSGTSRPAEGGGRLVVSDLDEDAARSISTAPAVGALGADQSNTSLRVGDGLVLKLFRRLQAGENPELEMLRFLSTRTTFSEMAAPRGALSFIDAAGAPHTVGLLQDWVANAGDGWHYVVSRLEAHLATPGGWPAWSRDMEALGRATARFHRASALDAGDPEFGARRLSAADVADWSAGLARRAAVALALLPGAGLPATAARRLTDWLDALASGTSAPTGPVAGEPLLGIRVHGDYHLGQTLKTPGGFVLIDFEGEPARPLAERRRRHHALKDVAGMIRSFEYAMAVAADQEPAAVERLRTGIPLETAFLSAYADEIGGSGLMPSGAAARADWLRFFILEKAVYELEYELNNRPAWASIPAQAILRLCDV